MMAPALHGSGRQLLLLLTFAGLVGCGPRDKRASQAPAAPPSAAAPSPRTEAGPAAGVDVGVDMGALEPGVSPCDDFYQYACGSWMKTTRIPDDEAAWKRSFDGIRERNEARLRAILERDAAGEGVGEPYAAQLGAYFAACMDEGGVERVGLEPLGDMLRAIDEVSDGRSLAMLLAKLHAGGVNAFFTFSSTPDFGDATRVIGAMEQSGLGLPEREYYLRQDPHARALRRRYAAHVQRMLELLGDAPAAAEARATMVVALEKELAQGSLTKVELRDPKKVYHRTDRAGLARIAPVIAWSVYFDALGAVEPMAINVAEPRFVQGVDAIVRRGEVDAWKAYLRWRVARSLAFALPARFVDESFRFKSVLTGAAKLAPRWKRCVRATDEAMGEALAIPFVKQTLGAEGKEAVSALVRSIEQSMRDNLEALAWMDATTRRRALEKLAAVANKIAYPDRWRSYDGLVVTRASFAANAVRAAAFEMRRQLAKIGKPVDRGEWEMSPPTVNAYYEASRNEMVFPAGILQRPFYANARSFGANYGGIGMVMGHELTHGFDDEGRQFDAAGNLRDWWTPAVGAEFDRRAACVRKQFDQYVVLGDVHVDGALTLGENIADLGGLKLAYTALARELASRRSPRQNGFTDEQQFFIGFAQAWCGNVRDEALRLMVSVNPHAPPRLRVNGPLSNVPQFARAFSCNEGAPMVRPARERCEVW